MLLIAIYRVSIGKRACADCTLPIARMLDAHTKHVQLRISIVLNCLHRFAEVCSKRM